MVKISDPEIVGAYSVDKDRNYQGNMGNLKYLKWQETFDIDLTLGEYHDKPPYKPEERIDQMTKFLMENEQDFVSNNKIDADFVCFRGVLKNILASPFSDRLFVIHAIKLKGTIYLCSIPSNEEQSNTGPSTFSRNGFKFESHVVSSSPDSDPVGSGEPLYEAEEFCVMMRRNIGDHRILFGIESDGVESLDEINDVAALKKAKLAEIKTIQSYVNDDKLVKNKSLAWWSQNYIAGINEVYVGVINNNFVEEGRIYKVNEMAVKAEERNNWNRTSCMNFLREMIDMIASDMSILDDAHTIYRYEFKKLSHSFEIKEGESFFSKEYINFINQL